MNSSRPPAKPHEDRWTTRRLLTWIGDAFTKKGLDSPRLCAEMLVSHVLGCDRLRLYLDADRPASELEKSTLRDLVGRALKDEPVQYLVGEKWFFGLSFHVDRRVLVPRPATETIVEQVLLHSRAEPGFGGGVPGGGEGVIFADVCTGSGCIAVALLKNLQRARAIATDVSADALEVARMNADKHGVTPRVEFVQGSLLEPIVEHPAGRKLHYLLANPPYIPDDEWEAVPANVKGYEPTLALRGGADGLDFVRPILSGAAALLIPGGLVMVEVAASRAEEAAAYAKTCAGLEAVRIEPDFEGLPRVIVARRKE